MRINNFETPVLQGLASSVPKNGLILEIGAASGWSITKMAEAADESVRLITIDPWDLLPMSNRKGFLMAFNEAVKPFGDRIQAIKDFSWNVDIEELLDGRTIDLLFIDGDHSHKASLADYEKFSPYANKWLVFHDYKAKQPGVDKTVDEYVIPSDLWKWYTSHRFWVGRRK